jgi:beta-1,3-galactosyltransferase 2
MSEKIRTNNMKERGFIAGKVTAGRGPHRDKSSKWHVPKELYKRDDYPPFTHGPDYVVTISAIPVLLKAISMVPFLYLEDVYLALLAETARVPLCDPGAMQIGSVPDWVQLRNYNNAHYVSPGSMLSFWQSCIQNKGSWCT